ncbi:uncharacterized protein LOC111338058 [Stylophora pistillata]|uniref:uncharacterized protein LOC111338058 n=1 Tax=Stylophora pistillata TaxID=50429 RepID=UPI000C0501CB|nr:uncharacterized protein LOC111338058 [Stylophora pistillata]
MEDEYREFTVPYVHVNDEENSLKGRLLLVTKRVLTSTTVRVLCCVAYAMFFIWQVIGLILYSIRAFEATLTARRASFQPADIISFDRSEQLELAWVISQVCNCALVLMAISRVPSFLGWSVIPTLLVRLPAFWSLLALFLMTIVGYGMILAQKNDEMMEICLIMVLAIDNGVQLVLISFLNFTQINHSYKQYPFKIFAFLKINIFFLFLSYFAAFVVSSLQIAIHVYGIEKSGSISDDCFNAIIAVRRFTEVVFSYRVYIFYWNKLFSDPRNILCHYDYLEEVTKEIRTS